MKDSGIDWIGNIPQEWDIIKVKYLFNISRGRVIAATDVSEEGLYPVFSSQTENNGCFGYINSYDYEGPAITRTTDGEKAGTVFFRDGKYNCTNICGILQLKEDKKENFNLKFLTFAIGMVAEQNKRKDTNGYKIMSNEMARIKFSLPPLSEQQKIADYLDKKCSKIDEQKENYEKSIELLKEYKQSLITHTLTNENDSKYYRIKNISYLKGRIGWQGLTTADYIESGPYLITGTDFSGSSISRDTCVHISENRFEEAPEIHIKQGDLLITKDGTVGKLAVIGDDCPEKVSLNSGVMLIRPLNNDVYYNKYLFYILKSELFRDWYNSSQKGNATIKHLYQEQFYNFGFNLPEIKKQKQIADYLDKECGKIDKVIAYREQMIEKFDEYKKSLIYECVTGKKEIK